MLNVRAAKAVSAAETGSGAAAGGGLCQAPPALQRLQRAVKVVDLLLGSLDETQTTGNLNNKPH